MQIDVITLFPEEFSAMTGLGVTGRAISNGVVELRTWNPRDYASDRHNSVDDRPYGGGPGMVMTVEPTRSAIRAARACSGQPCRVSMLSPQGQRLDQAALLELASRDRLVLLCGRYEGIDERLVETDVDEEWSIGDYVLSGGELAAAVIVDAVTRLLPEVLGDEDSAGQDSFMEGLLDHPHYSRPELVDGLGVPPVLLSGDHGAIARWRKKQAIGRTWQRRPDLLEQIDLDDESKALLDEFIRDNQVELE
jgi:tRNA (guanine37-N1)-methyltransferase